MSAISVSQSREAIAARGARGYLGAMARIDLRVLRRERAGHPALSWPRWTDEVWEPAGEPEGRAVAP